MRKKHYIDKSVQGALIRRSILHWGLLYGLTFGLLFCWQMLVGDPYASFSSHLQAIWARYAPFFIVLFLLVPAFMLDLIKLSNRFAGPIFRLRTVMKDWADGKEVRPIKFRDNDYWLDLADSFNTVLARAQAAEAQVGETTTSETTTSETTGPEKAPADEALPGESGQGESGSKQELQPLS